MPAMVLMPSMRRSNLARQILALQLVVVLIVVVGALALAYVDARRDQLELARNRVTAVAVALSDDPAVLEALDDADPSVTIQPLAERVRRDTRTEFVTVMTPDRERLAHRNPDNIGKDFIGTIAPALDGKVFTEEYAGTLGPSMRAVAPVREGDDVVALVSVGIGMDQIQQDFESRLPPIALAAAAVLATGGVGAWLISRRVRRQTHGMGEREITRMYEYYDSVLHSVREGLLLIDADGVVQLANVQAHHLLGLDAPVGRRVDELGLPEALVATIVAPESRSDELHLALDRVLVVNQEPTVRDGRRIGSVITLRDHTEIQEVAAELDSVRGLADSLRAQNHEASNRLHTVVSLIETGHPDDAVEFATRELEVAQRLTDRIVESVDEPVVSALLLGKSALAAERGVDLVIDPDTEVTSLALEARDVVTIMGNLLDNALDAVLDSPTRRVEVGVQSSAERFVLRVCDSGPGLDAADHENAFGRGWSTKPSRSPAGRGLGLALVGQTVRRYDGVVEIEESHLGGASFVVTIELGSRP